MNPLNNKSTQQGFNQMSNPINDMLAFLNNGGNEKQLYDQFLKNNPQLNELMQIKNPKGMVMQIAKKNGIDIKQIEELAHRLGAK